MTHSYDAATVQRLVDCNVALVHGEDTILGLQEDGRYFVLLVSEQTKQVHPDFPAAWAAWLAACGLDAERPEFQPDWNNAPEEATAWAMDANDEQHWYEKEPRIHEDFEVWRPLPDSMWGRDNTDYGDVTATLDWRYSLRRRLEVTP